MHPFRNQISIRRRGGETPYMRLATRRKHSGYHRGAKLHPHKGEQRLFPANYIRPPLQNFKSNQIIKLVEATENFNSHLVALVMGGHYSRAQEPEGQQGSRHSVYPRQYSKSYDRMLRRGSAVGQRLDRLSVNTHTNATRIITNLTRNRPRMTHIPITRASN